MLPNVDFFSTFGSVLILKFDKYLTNNKISLQ